MSSADSTSSQPAQRRRHFRVPVRPDSGLQVRAWKIAPGTPLSHRPMPSQELKLRVREVSEGGLTITLPSPAQATLKPPTVGPDDRLRIEIRQGTIELLIEGRLRAKPGQSKPDGTVETGIQFVNRQGDPAVSILQTVVGILRRADIRAARAEKVA